MDIYEDRLCKSKDLSPSLNLRILGHSGPFQVKATAAYQDSRSQQSTRIPGQYQNSSSGFRVKATATHYRLRLKKQ